MTISEESGIERDLVFKTDLLDSFKVNPSEVIEKFMLLHKKNFLNNSLDKYWRMKNLLTPRSLLRAVFTECVLKTISRELNRGEDVRVRVSDVERELKNMLDKEILADLADIKLKKKRRPRKSAQKDKLEASDLQGQDIPQSVITPNNKVSPKLEKP